MMFGSCAVSLLFFVVVTVVLVVVDPPAVVFDPPVVAAFVPATLGLSTGVVTDVVDDAETVVSAVDCLDGAQPPSMSAAAIKEHFVMVVIGCAAGFAR
jgi:hypothetical protein